MRVLVLVHHFPPDVNSTGQLMAEVAQGLRRLGDEVAILTTFPHYAEFRTWPEYRGRLTETTRDDGLRVTRVWSWASGTKSMSHRLLNYVSFNALASIRGAAMRWRPDVILATNGSFFSGVTAWLVGGLHVPFVYNLQDLYPEVPIQAGQLRNHTAIRALRAIEQFMYHRASRVSVITPSFRAYLLERGMADGKISVIPNFVDTEFIRPLPKDNPWSRRIGLDDKFVVSHAGYIGLVYDFATLLAVADRMRGLRDVVFLIVGNGVTKDAVVASAKRDGLNNVMFLPYQPREELPWMRAASDVQVSLYTPEAARYSMPSKIYEIMASGRPLVASADADSDVRRVTEESGAGVWVPSGDPDLLESAILELRADPQRREDLGGRGRAAAEAKYSKHRVVAQHRELLTAVANGSIKS
jgi:colanic acid biosynthesis glycosyl transferase WcaI